MKMKIKIKRHSLVHLDPEGAIKEEQEEEVQVGIDKKQAQ